MLTAETPISSDEAPMSSAAVSEAELRVVANSDLPNAAELLKALRSELEADLRAAPQHLDLVGDGRLLRFLEGYSGSVDKASEAYRAMLKWRSDKRIEEHRAFVEGKPYRPESFVLADKIYPLMKSMGADYPIYDAGTSRDGHQLHLEVIGTGDPSKLLEGASLEELEANYFSLFEMRSMLLERKSLASGKLVKTVQVRDLSRFGLHLIKHRKATSTLQGVLKAALDNYPESLERAIFVNTSSSFQVLWKLIALVINARTAEKTTFLGTDYHDQMLEQLPPLALARLQRMIEDPTSANEEGTVLAPRTHDASVSVGARYTTTLRYFVTREQLPRCSWRALGQVDSGLQLGVGLLRAGDGTPVREQLVAKAAWPSTKEDHFEFPPNGEAHGFLELNFSSDAWIFSCDFILQVRLMGPQAST